MVSPSAVGQVGRFALFLAAVAGTAQGQQVSTWKNATGNGQWGTAANWDPNGVPGVTSMVEIPAGPACSITQPAQALHVSAPGPLTLTSTLSIPAGGTFSDFAGAFPGTLVCNAPATFDGTASSATMILEGTGPYIVTGTMAITGLRTKSPFVNNATVVLFGGSIEYQAPGIFTNNGLVQILSTGDKMHGAGSQFINNGDVTFNAGGLGYFQQNTTYRQIGGSTGVTLGTFGLGTSVWEGGTVEVGAAGSIQLLPFGAGTATFDGLLGMSGAGSVVYTGLTNPTPPLMVLKDIEFDLTGGFVHNGSGGFGIEARVTNRGLFVVSAAAGLQGSGEFVNEAGATLTAPNGLSIKSGLIVQNKGVLQPKLITLSTGGTLVNEPGGMVTLPMDGIIQSAGNPGRVHNKGEFMFEGGTQVVSVPFDQTGGFTGIAPNGFVALNAGGEWGGASSTFGLFTESTLTIGPGTILVSEGSHAVVGLGGNFLVQNQSAVIQVDQGATLTLDVVPDGPFGDGVFMSQGILTGAGLVKNDGLMRVTGGTVAMSAGGELLNLDDLEIAGAKLDSRLNNAGTVKQGATFTIMQAAEAVNLGVWTCRPESASVYQLAGAGLFENNALFETFGGAMLIVNVQCTFTNNGQVSVNGNDILDLTNATLPQYTGGVLAGGVWSVAPDAELRLPVLCTQLTSDSAFSCSGNSCDEIEGLGLIDDGAAWECNGDTILNGPLDMTTGGRCSVESGFDLEVPGECNVGKPGPASSALAFAEDTPVFSDSAVAPGRIVTPILNNRGFVRPGGPGEFGWFEVAGNYQQFATGAVQIEIGGTTPGVNHDLFTVTGSAALAGTLELSFAPGFTPMLGEVYDIMSFASKTGAFDNIVSPVHPSGLRLSVAVGASGVSAQAVTGCYADCDQDGSLSFFDFLCFQNAFATGSSHADCDLSGALDFFDFLCFQNAFAAGCD